MSELKELHRELFDDPQRFEFFQAVRLLERLFPERATIGRDGLPASEVVRFRSHPTLNFPASEIHNLEETPEPTSSNQSDEPQQLEMLVNFMGLIGASGVLPAHYTELVIERARYRDTSFWAFVDIFTHRAVSLFYRAWEKYRFAPDYERAQNDRHEIDEFTNYLFDFIGFGTRGLRGRMSLPDESLLPYAGLLSNKPHSAVNLEQILTDYFKVPVKIEQFFGQWLRLDEDCTTRLGTANSKLGLSTIAGERVFDRQSKFRVRIGVIGFEQFKAFLPNNSAYSAISSLVRFVVGQEFDFDLQLVLAAREVPSCILTTRAQRRPQLGWSSFLKTQKYASDNDQVILASEKPVQAETQATQIKAVGFANKI